MNFIANNIWGIKPINLYGNDRPTKRTLGIRDKKILYNRAKKRCEGCGKKIDFDEMQAGHKNPASKGGSATLKNSVCICWKCNNNQGTDTWAVFMRKMGKSETRSVTSGKKRKSTRKKVKRRERGIFDLAIAPATIRLPKSRSWL